MCVVCVCVCLCVCVCVCVCVLCVRVCSQLHLSPPTPLHTPSPQLVDYRVEFSKWWVSEFKVVKFPSQGTVFDYLLDGETKKWVHWTEKVPKFELDPEVPLQVCPYCNLAYISTVN